jgi:hypothetical protein
LARSTSYSWTRITTHPDAWADSVGLSCAGAAMLVTAMPETMTTDAAARQRITACGAKHLYRETEPEIDLFMFGLVFDQNVRRLCWEIFRRLLPLGVSRLE